MSGLRLRRSGKLFQLAEIWRPRLQYIFAISLIILAVMPFALRAQSRSDRVTWKSVDFAIVRFNDDAPRSWNMYHGEKRGLLLLRLWKRYLFINVPEQEVFEVDPGKVTAHEGEVQWSPADVPQQPLEISDWKERDVGSMRRIRFRFGLDGHYVDIQIPLQANGKPLY